MLLARTLASSIFLLATVAHAAQQQDSAAEPVAPPAPTSQKAAPRRVPPYRLAESSNRARNYYQFMWGIDSMGVKSVESGELIRFNYRVLDVEKAKALNDKKSSPYLIDEKARVKLVVPSLEKVGQLRQSTAPEVGKVYWMVFSNKGNLVKPGNRVSVIIGKFRVDGLIVQ